MLAARSPEEETAVRRRESQVDLAANSLLAIPPKLNCALAHIKSRQRSYQWVDEIPLSRPKRSIARDFADGVLVAEIVAHYFPRLVELHNYSGGNGYAQKIYNWYAAAGPHARAMGTCG